MPVAPYTIRLDMSASPWAELVTNTFNQNLAQYPEMTDTSNAQNETERKGNYMNVPDRIAADYLTAIGLENIGSGGGSIRLVDILTTSPIILRRARAAYKRVNEAWLQYATTLTFEQRFDAFRGEMRVKRGTVQFIRYDDGGLNSRTLPAVYSDLVPMSEIVAAVPGFPTWATFAREGGYLYLRAAEGASVVHKNLIDNYFPYSVYTPRANNDGVDAYDARYVYKYLKNDFVAKYRAQLREAYRLNRTTPEAHLPRGQRNQKKFTPRQKQERLEKYLAERKAKVQAVNLSEFVIPGHGTLSSRNWGIEVESGGARGVQAPVGWNRKYDGSLSSAYDGRSTEEHPGEEPLRPEGHFDLHSETIHHHGPDNNGPCQNDPNPNFVPEDNCDECAVWYEEHDEWQEAYDRYNDSYDSGDDDDDCAEFVSPILHSFHSKGLEKIVTALAENPQNDSAGVHVHVDAGDLTAQQIGGLVYGYNVLEPLLEQSYRRNTREYCKPRPLSEVFSIEKQIEEGTDPRRNYLGDRYVSLNVNSLVSHGTIEFRAMGPVYDYEYLTRWAYLCRELVNAAKNGATRKDYMAVHNFTDLKNFLIRFGNESVDNALSQITDEDIVRMGEKNEDNLYRAEREFALVGGEI